MKGKREIRQYSRLHVPTPFKSGPYFVVSLHRVQYVMFMHCSQYAFLLQAEIINQTCTIKTEQTQTEINTQ